MSELRAFTVKPIWGIFILNGIKDCENRNIAPRPHKGIAAVHISSTYTRKEHEATVAMLPAKMREQLTWESLRPLCGRIIGVVEYSVEESTTSPWWDKSGKPIMITNMEWLPEPFIPCKGALQFWHVPEDVAEQVQALFPELFDSKDPI